MMMLEKEEMQPGAAPVAFPSPIFVGSDSVSWFLCFSASSSPPLEIASGGLYIVSFRSRRTSGDQDGRLATLDEGTDIGGAVRGWTAPPGLVGPLVYFKCSICSFCKNINPRKSPGPFEFRKVPET